MPVRSGRLEKRIRLAVPVQISSFLDPAATERTTTENVCSLGIRILTQRARDLNERLMICSLMGDLRTLARVVYCQRLPDGRFGVGLQFQGEVVNWSKGSMAGATDWTASTGNLRRMSCWPRTTLVASVIIRRGDSTDGRFSLPEKALSPPCFRSPGN